MERVSNHTLIMLPLELPHRKRGSTTILLTAAGVQDHDDVLYNYALYSCTIVFILLLGTVETRGRGPRDCPWSVHGLCPWTVDVDAVVLTRGDLSMDVDAVVLTTGDLSMDSSTFGCPWTHLKRPWTCKFKK